MVTSKLLTYELELYISFRVDIYFHFSGFYNLGVELWVIW